jgi:hypothetical protein
MSGVLTLEKPLKFEQPGKLTVTLRHGGDLGSGIGQFPLSVTPDITTH